MTASPEQIAVLEKVLRGLGSLREEVVLVGGMAVGFLVTDPGAEEPRETIDVDLIIEVTSRVGYYETIRKHLLAHGFREDTRPGAPLCRWLLDAEVVDVMPTDPRVLGFSNAWYAHAIATSTKVTLSSTERGPTALRLISAPAFCATKLASFASRGAGDLLHADIEDVISLVDGRKELLSELDGDLPELRAFVSQSIAKLLQVGLEENVASLLRGDAASQAREPRVVAILRRIASLRAPGT